MTSWACAMALAWRAVRAFRNRSGHWRHRLRHAIAFRETSNRQYPAALRALGTLAIPCVSSISRNALCPQWRPKGPAVQTFAFAAGSWPKARRVVARVEVSSRGRDTRYIVTNLNGVRGKHLYEKLYSARGQAENHIKPWKTHLAADRTSCSKAQANQMRVRRAYAAPPGPRSRLTATWLRLLDLVDPPRGLPEAFPVAPRPVRHAAPAPRQARCRHRREEDPHHRDAAGVLSPARAITLPLQCPRATRTSLTQSAPQVLKPQPT